MPRFADLHLHTTASDGTSTPAEVVARARDLGFAAIAICDHDTVASYPAVRAAGAAAGVEIIPGVEISTEVEAGNQHILGYYLDTASAELQATLDRLKRARETRMRTVIGRLAGLGITVTEAELWARSGGGSLGRPHLAALLLERGLVTSIHEAFDKYLGRGRPAFVPKEVLTAPQAIRLIAAAGGIPVLAHPIHLHREEAIPGLIAAGIRGLEVYYPDHSPDDERRYLAIARREKLLITGGSDCHGRGKDRILMGSVKLAWEHVEQLREAHRR